MNSKEYFKILNKCKFISKEDEWFLAGTECKLEYELSGNFLMKKFNDTAAVFQGLTMETFDGYTGELPREDGEYCPLCEFLIYDEFGNEISELTLDEYYELIKNNNYDSRK